MIPAIGPGVRCIVVGEFATGKLVVVDKWVVKGEHLYLPGFESRYISQIDGWLVYSLGSYFPKAARNRVSLPCAVYLSKDLRPLPDNPEEGLPREADNSLSPKKQLENTR